MARKHRALSLSTKLKIAASLRGNKNAYRGGPKKRLTSREKVANINAKTRANRLVLNDAQLKQRSAVAKRLRARARSEEAGIKPDHTKSIATPETIDKVDSKIRADSARIKGTVAKREQKFTRAGRGKQTRTGNVAAKVTAGKNHSVTSEFHQEAVRQRIASAHAQGRIGLSDFSRANIAMSDRISNRRAIADHSHVAAKTELRSRTSARVAKANTGKGKFSYTATLNSISSGIHPDDDHGIMKSNFDKLAAMNPGAGRDKAIKTFVRDFGGIGTAAERQSILKTRLNFLRSADRSDPAKIGDPTVKQQTPKKFGQFPLNNAGGAKDLTDYSKSAEQRILQNKSKAPRAYKPKPMPRGGFGGKGL